MGRECGAPTDGTTVSAGAFAVGRISGGAFTPAVSLGAAVGGLFGWSTPWVHIVVQVVAGAAAGLTFLALNPDDKRSGRGTPLRPHQPHTALLYVLSTGGDTSSRCSEPFRSACVREQELVCWCWKPSVTVLRRDPDEPLSSRTGRRSRRTIRDRRA
ncbi:aquaporin [Saccharopolyspora shandongensis]|uniref:aquaporin n=1 Tax=Saccharopolyspora shandongensis TaxID=418495 RepID=UPI00343B02D3